MKATPLAVLAAALMAVLCAVSPAPASAQGAASAGRADIFTVAGIQVDETAANASAAQAQGFASAARIGFERLVRRITSPADQQRLGVPQPDAATLERLALSVDVESERRSATRYLARLTVRFDPAGTRAVLTQAGYPSAIEQRTAPVLIVALGDASVTPDVATAWRAAWSEGGYGQELAPLALAPANAAGGDWAAIYPFAQAEAASTAIVATLHVQGSTATASLREVSAQGARDRPAVSAPIAGNDAASLRTALNALARQVSDSVQNDWKARAGGGSSSTQTVSRSRVSASALYASQREWEQIKSALEAAAATVISQIRIEAVARNGALVSFSFTGDRAQLAAELARRGVTLSDSPTGPVLRVAAQH